MREHEVTTFAPEILSRGGRRVDGSTQTIREPGASAKPKLLGQVRPALRTRHYSLSTEQAYVHWIRRFILFHNKRHPK
ncbi:MAG: phage integrase N-terminal SAM-like domain-containing protein, partial [bacterium]